MPDILSNLILHCPLTETSGTSIADATGLHASGTFSGATLSTITGPFGGTAINFNGTDQTITFADASDFDVTTSFTVSAWVKTSTASLLMFLTKQPVDFSSGYEFGISGGAQMTILRPVGVNAQPAAPDFNDNTWHHVTHVTTVSGGTAEARHYLDGVLVYASGFITWSPGANADSLYIGSRFGSSLWWSGGLSDLRIYTRALAPTDVEQLASVTRQSLLTGLQAYWPCWDSGNLTDVHRGRNLTETGGTIPQVAGKVQGARDFESTNSDYFTRTDTNLDIGPAFNVTLTAWIKLESYVQNSVAFSKGWAHATATNRSFVLYRAGNTGVAGPMLFAMSGPSGQLSLTCTAGSPGLGTWYWMVISWDYTRRIMSIGQNNVYNTVYGANGTNAPYAGATGFEIGSSSGQSLFWDGLICEVGLWRRLLTAAELDFLYNSGAGRTYPFGEDTTPNVSFL